MGEGPDRRELSPRSRGSSRCWRGRVASLEEASLPYLRKHQKNYSKRNATGLRATGREGRDTQRGAGCGPRDPAPAAEPAALQLRGLRKLQPPPRPPSEPPILMGHLDANVNEMTSDEASWVLINVSCLPRAPATPRGPSAAASHSADG